MKEHYLAPHIKIKQHITLLYLVNMALNSEWNSESAFIKFYIESAFNLHDLAFQKI